MFDKLFGAFDEAKQFMGELTMAANQKAAAAKETAEVTEKSKSNIQGITATYAQSANEALGRLDTIKAQGDEARRMADSDNIIDRITLIGEQMLNPRAYTREGRSNQVSEMSQNLALEGQANNIKIANEEATIAQAQAHEAASTAGVDAKLNTMKMQVDGLALMNQGIMQAETMRQNHLTLAPQVDIQKALMGPPKPNPDGTPSQKIVLGGFEYTPTELRERDKALTTRTQLSLLSPQATDPDYAAKLRTHQDLQLGNYNVAELQALKQNGYIMPDGTQVEPSLWDAHYQRQNALQTDAINLAINQNTLDNTVPRMLSESQAMLANTMSSAQPGTPMAAARNNFEIQLKALADVSANPEYAKNPAMKIAQVAGVQKAQQQFMQAVDDEAKLQAGGNSELASIYRNQILGMPVTGTQVEDYFRGSYTNGKGFGNILSNEANNRIRKNADDNFTKLQTQNQGASMMGTESKKSVKELREDAINQALETERKNYGISGANIIMMQSSTRTDNPAVKAGMPKGQIDEITGRANSETRTAMMQKYGITDAQMNAIMIGNGPSEGVPAEKSNQIAQDFMDDSTIGEYEMYEKFKPGLGYEMQQWLMSELPGMAKRYAATLSPTERAMTGDAVDVEVQGIASRYLHADESRSRRGKQAVMEVTTGIKRPENMWPMLLQADKRLADSQKHSIYYDVIEPTIKAAKARGANDEATSEAVFGALNGFKSDDASLNSAVKTMMRDLPDHMDTFNSQWKLIMGQSTAAWNPFFKGQPSTNDRVTSAVESALPWLNKTTPPVTTQTGAAMLGDATMKTIQQSTQEFRNNLQSTERGLGQQAK